MNQQQTRACFLLACNFTEAHFKEIFKYSELGYEYFWDKLQGFIEDNGNSADGFCRFVLYLDSHNLMLLTNFLSTYK
jgi:hypothetical protein